MVQKKSRADHVSGNPVRQPLKNIGGDYLHPPSQFSEATARFGRYYGLSIDQFQFCFLRLSLQTPGDAQHESSIARAKLSHSQILLARGAVAQQSRHDADI